MRKKKKSAPSKKFYFLLIKEILLVEIKFFLLLNIKDEKIENSFNKLI
jgi:hypothetical protein